MKFAVLNKFSLSLALISCLSAGAASAQSLTGVNARLDQNLDSKTAAAGQAVTARLNGSAKTSNGIDLPKGTELIGKIAEAKTSQNGGPATVSIVFNTAKLKSGKEIPVKATLLAAFSPDQGDQGVADAPQSVSDKTEVTQGPGALGKVSLEAAVKNSDSGTFTKNDGNFRLDRGTYLQVAIAPAATASGTSAAE